MSKLEDLKQMMADAEARLKSEGQAALHEAFAELFDANQQLKAVTWLQYTDYFNDGDPCTFSVHDFEARLDLSWLSQDGREAFDDAGYYASDDAFGYGDNCHLHRLQRARLALEHHTTCRNAITNIYRAAPSGLMLSVFGDHAQVTATRDGFNVEHCDHD